MPRFTEPERENIRETILELYLMGYRTAAIRRLLASHKGPKPEEGKPEMFPNGVHISVRGIDHYLEDVREEMRATARFDRDEELGKAMKRMVNIQRSCKRKGDERGMLMAQKEINMVLGLITHHVDHKGALTVEDFIRGQTNDPKPRAPRGEASGAGVEFESDEDDDESREPKPGAAAPEPGPEAGGEGGVHPE